MEKQIIIEDGSTLVYRGFGSKKNPVILFANGSIFNYKQFFPTFFPTLRRTLHYENYSYLFYDYVGIGNSSPLEGQFDFIKLAGQQEQFLDALGLDKVHLFGFSKGSIINQLMTTRSQNRVLSFAGFGNPNLAYDPSNDMARKEFGGRLEPLKLLKKIWNEPISDKNYNAVYDIVFIPTIFIGKNQIDLTFSEHLQNQWIKSKLKPMLIGTKIDILNKLYSYFLEEITLEEKQRYIEAISEITVPTLLMHGLKDETIPFESSVLLDEWMPNSELHLINGLTHSRPTIWKWDAQKIMEIYANFLQNLN